MTSKSDRCLKIKLIFPNYANALFVSIYLPSWLHSQAAVLLKQRAAFAEVLVALLPVKEALVRLHLTTPVFPLKHCRIKCSCIP